MPLTNVAKTTIERPLPKEKIRQRPGKGGLTFDYVTPDFVISLLNEAFDYRWDTRIVSQEMHGDTAVVALELTVYDAEGNPISKQQFGSGDVSRGMGPGEAFKSAASDALKKAATLLGVALELYQNDEVPLEGEFRRPSVPPKAPTKPAAAPAPSVPRTPPTPPKSVAAPTEASLPTGPAASRVPPTPPTPPAAPQSVSAPESVAKPVNPFDNGSKQAAPVAPKSAAPAPPVGVPEAKSNPFASRNQAAGPNPTQLNALTNLANRKGLSQPDMIALVNNPVIVDETGNPKQAFEELTHAEAIKVIKASQV